RDLPLRPFAARRRHPRSGLRAAGPRPCHAPHPHDAARAAEMSPQSSLPRNAQEDIMQTPVTRLPTRPEAGRARRASADGYALGYSEHEFRRLEMQSRIIGDLTEDVLQRAGIRKGMRVLDLGCGVGDVSLLAAWLVGPSGFVLGVDRSADALAAARRRAREAGQS